MAAVEVVLDNVDERGFDGCASVLVAFAADVDHRAVGGTAEVADVAADELLGAYAGQKRGLAGYTHHHREVSDSQVPACLRGTVGHAGRCVITLCAIVAATTDRTTRPGWRVLTIPRQCWRAMFPGRGGPGDQRRHPPGASPEGRMTVHAR